MIPDDKGLVPLSRRAFLAGLTAGGLAVAMADLESVLAWSDAADPPRKGTPGTRMEEGQPSVTAQWSAVLRAAHQLLDEPKILDDPLALRIIGGEAESAIRSSPHRFGGDRYLRALIALRSRYAEDDLFQAVGRGVRQYVILGAGLDTFAYRNPHPAADLRVFEVDHPATQVWKRSRLREAGIPVPDSLTFASIDFERQTLLEGLDSAGFRKDQPAYFSMLGVVIYLSGEAVMETLRCVASLSPGSEIVFDYGIPSHALTELSRMAREFHARRAAAVGEPWVTYFDPGCLAGELLRLGFTNVKDLTPEEANERYFKGRTDGLRVGSSTHMMKAGL